jgi:tetratricopeptide (TPR) repeat protein
MILAGQRRDVESSQRFVQGRAWTNTEVAALLLEFLDDLRTGSEYPTKARPESPLACFVAGVFEMVGAVQVWNEERIERAVAHFDLAVLASPVARLSHHFMRARALSLLPKQSTKARDAAEALLTLWPTEPQSLWMAASCLLNGAAPQQQQRSIELLEQAIDRAPEFVELHRALACALARLGQRERAIAEFRFVLERQPGMADAWSEYGQVLAEQGELEPALAAIQRGVDLDPGDASAWLRLVITLKRLARQEAALAACDAALARLPDQRQLLEQRANILLRLERYEAARHSLERALQQAPGDPRTLYLLATTQQRLGDSAAALTAAREWLRAAGPEPNLDGLALLAELELLAGTAPAAIAILERAKQRLQEPDVQVTTNQRARLRAINAKLDGQAGRGRRP